MMLAYLCDVFPNCSCAAAAAFATSPRRVLRPGLHGQPRSTVCVVCVGVSQGTKQDYAARWFFARHPVDLPTMCFV